MTQSFTSIVLPRLVATALSVGLAAWATNGILKLSASDVVRSLASVIESGQQPRSEILDQLHESEQLKKILTSCDRSDLRALATTQLKDFDIALVEAEPTRADRAAAAAETAIRQALACAPLDGNLWLRLAALDTARRGPSSNTIEYLRLSHWTAPGEGWIVRARVNFASRLFEAGIKDVEPDLRSDVRTLVFFDAPDSVAELLVALPQSIQPIYREWIALLPQNRKNDVKRYVERHGGNLGDI
jgi:hypothetical protein